MFQEPGNTILESSISIENCDFGIFLKFFEKISKIEF